MALSPGFCAKGGDDRAAASWCDKRAGRTLSLRTLTMTRNTVLHAVCLEHGARMATFAGWRLPLHFGSQIQEHQAVRQHAGLFDVSHMSIHDLEGEAALPLLRRLLAGDAARLKAPGSAFYSLLLNADAGILDDLLVYRRSNGYRLITNAGTRDVVHAHLTESAHAGVRLLERRLSILALQGPSALQLLEAFLPGVGALPPFGFMEQDECMVARTGYTGEDGVEMVLPEADAPGWWRRLVSAGAQPAGLGARDTLRLEAGLRLHGADMDASINPLEAGLMWCVHDADGERDFIGRQALAAARRDGVSHRTVGARLPGRGVLRAGQTLNTNAGPGVITSGAFSPTLGYSIALARVPQAAAGEAEALIRGKLLPTLLVQPPFVRRGQPAFKPLHGRQHERDA